jgi:hypothetical protein
MSTPGRFIGVFDLAGNAVLLTAADARFRRR